MPQVTFSQLAGRHVSVYVLLNARIIIASLNFCSTKKNSFQQKFLRLLSLRDRTVQHKKCSQKNPWPLYGILNILFK